MHLLIACCPEAQIFQPNYQVELLDDPERMFSEFINEKKGQRVELVVPRGTGPLTFYLGIPKPIGGRYGTDKSQDMLALADWLSGGSDGGRNQETDSYGVVSLGVDETEMTSLIEAMYTSLASGGSFDSRKFSGGMKKRYDELMTRARIQSRERVYRQIRRVHGLMESQIRINKETSNAGYDPSPSEWLCRYALRQEIDERNERRSRLRKQIDLPLTDDFLEAPPHV